MRHMALIAAFLLVSILLFPGGLGESRIEVVATLEIYASFAKEIGGDRVSVDYIVPQGMDIHSYSLRYEDIEKIEKSDLIILASSEFFSLDANILEKVQGKEILDFPDYNATLFSLDGLGRNVHGYWLYPKNALGICKAIEKKLESMDPAGKDYYRANFEKLSEEINKSLSIAKSLSKNLGLENKTALLAVPGTYYIVKTLGMKIKGSIVRGPNQFIGGEELQEIKREIKEGEISLIVNAAGLEKSRAGEIAQQLSVETGVRVAYIDIFSAENYTALLLNDAAILAGGLHTNVYGGSQEFSLPYILIILILSGIVAISLLEVYLCRKELLK